MFKIKTVDWLPDDTSLVVMNAVDEVTRIDLTGEEVTKTIQKPKMVIIHHGETEELKKLKENQ